MPQIIVKGVKSREMPKMAVECSAKLADICPVSYTHLDVYKRQFQLF